MKATIDPGRMLRLISRQMARCLTRLEARDCEPEVLKDVKQSFGWLRSDLIELVEDKKKRGTCEVGNGLERMD